MTDITDLAKLQQIHLTCTGRYLSDFEIGLIAGERLGDFPCPTGPVNREEVMRGLTTHQPERTPHVRAGFLKAADILAPESEPYP